MQPDTNLGRSLVAMVVMLGLIAICFWPVWLIQGIWEWIKSWL